MSDRDLLLQRAARHARTYLDAIDERAVRSHSDSAALQHALGGAMQEDGEDPVQVIDALACAAQESTVATQGPRYFGFVTGSSLPVATAADWLVSAWDQNAALHVMSPFSAAVAEKASQWIKELVGLPTSWSVGYVTGGAMANFTSLAAARHATLRRAGWDVEASGLFGAPDLRVLVNEESHYTIATALRMLGLGVDRITKIAADTQGRMRTDALARALEAHQGPCIVCAQAGNVNSGAFDPIDRIAALSHEHGAWLHVDAAFGLWAVASPALRPLLQGIEQADSIATDAHKWLNVPYDCGIVLCADGQAHHQAMTLSAPYIEETVRHRDSREYVPEESHRARAVPVYAVLRTLGRAGLQALVERCCRHARHFAAHLGAAGHKVLNDVVLNQVVVAFGDAETTDRVIASIQAEGTCWCGGTRWHDRAAMRISVCSWATTEQDVERSLAAILDAAR